MLVYSRRLRDCCRGAIPGREPLLLGAQRTGCYEGDSAGPGNPVFIHRYVTGNPNPVPKQQPSKRGLDVVLCMA